MHTNRIKLYRVEHRETCIGPFGNHGAVFYSGDPDADQEHPYNGDDPYGEDIAFDQEYDHFGCRSMDELREWFKGKYVWDLAEHDYVLRVFETPEYQVTHGYTQAAFPRWMRCSVIEEHPVTVLLI